MWRKAITRPNAEKVPKTHVFTNQPPPSQTEAQNGCEMQPGRRASEVDPGLVLEPRLAPSEPRAEQGCDRPADDTPRAVPQAGPGRAMPSPCSQGPLPLSFPAGRPEAELGPREIFRPPLMLLLPPSLQMSSPASFVGRRGQGKGQDLKHPQPTSPDTPYTRIASGSAACCMTEPLTSPPLCFGFHNCKMG